MHVAGKPGWWSEGECGGLAREGLPKACPKRVHSRDAPRWMGMIMMYSIPNVAHR